MSDTTPNDQPQIVYVDRPKRGHPTLAWITGVFGLVIGLGPALFYVGALAFGAVGLLLGIGAYRAARKLGERAGFAGILTGLAAIAFGIVGAITVESAVSDLEDDLERFDQEMEDLDAEWEAEDAEFEAELEADQSEWDAYDEAYDEWVAEGDALYDAWFAESDAAIDAGDYDAAAAIDARYELLLAEHDANEPEMPYRESEGGDG